MTVLFASLVVAARRERTRLVVGEQIRSRTSPHEITRAFDFSDNLGTFMVGERRAYAIRNAAVAEAFTAATQRPVVTDDVRVRQQRRAGGSSVSRFSFSSGGWSPPTYESSERRARTGPVNAMTDRAARTDSRPLVAMLAGGGPPPLSADEPRLLLRPRDDVLLEVTAHVPARRIERQLTTIVCISSS